MLFNTLCIFLQVGFRACPLAFQSFVEDGFFIWNKHWPEQKCPDTHGVRLQPCSCRLIVLDPIATHMFPCQEQVVLVLLMTDSLQTVRKSR